MPVYVIDLTRLHNQLKKELGDFPLFTNTYLYWFEAVLNYDDEDELNFRLNDGDVFYTDYEKETIERSVVDYIGSFNCLDLDARITYDISPGKQNLILRFKENRKDMELSRLRSENSELRHENHTLTTRLEEYEE